MPKQTIKPDVVAKYVAQLRKLYEECESIATDMAEVLDQWEDPSELDQDGQARFEAISEAQAYLEGGQLSDALDCINDLGEGN